MSGVVEARAASSERPSSYQLSPQQPAIHRLTVRAERFSEVCLVRKACSDLLQMEQSELDELHDEIRNDGIPPS